MSDPSINQPIKEPLTGGAERADPTTLGVGDRPATPPRSRRARIARFILALVVLVLILGGAHHFGAGAALDRFLRAIAALGPLGPIVFILAYIGACVLLIPGSILTVGAGVLFGVVWGAIYVSIGATTGATAAFLIARYLARGWVTSRLARYPRLRAIDAAVGREGWKMVLLTRLSPVFPFNLLNYAYGLTPVRLEEYLAASWLGMLPGIAMYVYIGALAGDLTRLGSTARPAGYWVLNLVGFAATVAIALYAAALARRAIAEARMGAL